MDKSQGHLESFIYVYSFVFCSFALAMNAQEPCTMERIIYVYFSVFCFVAYA